jgi:hypothetical protein
MPAGFDSQIANGLGSMKLQDVLAHLPISAAVEYSKGQIIYGPDQPSTNIYLIVAGLKTANPSDKGAAESDRQEGSGGQVGQESWKAGRGQSIS